MPDVASLFVEPGLRGVETLIFPEVMAVPGVLSTIVFESVNTTSPLVLTMTLEACFISPPVNNSGNNRGVKLEISSPFCRDVAWNFPTSKLNKCPGWDILSVLPPSTAAMVIFPPGVESSPVLITVPPSKVRLFPGVRLKFPWLTIAPGLDTLNL